MKFEKGKPVSLSSEKKVELGLRQAVSSSSGIEVRWPSDIAILQVDATAIGTPQSPKARTTGRGVFTLNRRNVKNSDILMPRTKTSFVIEVEDAKDEWGLPDVKVTKFSMK